MVIGTDCTGSCQSNYRSIMFTTVPGSIEGITFISELRDYCLSCATRISRGCLSVISHGLPTMWLNTNNLRCVICCKPEDWFVLLRFRLLYIHCMNIINNDISPIAVLQFNPIGFGIHSINDVRLLRKHYVTRHGFRGAC